MKTICFLLIASCILTVSEPLWASETAKTGNVVIDQGEQEQVLMTGSTDMDSDTMFKNTPISKDCEQIPASSSDIEKGERWSKFLPIWGEEAKKAGYVLPLPFGISLNYLYMEEPARVTELRLGADKNNLKPIKILSVDSVDVKAGNSNLRLDAWIFPFLNLYGIFGYTSGKADLGLTINALTPGGSPTTFPLDIDYDGATYGGGIVLGGGYGRLFCMVDTNLTHTDLDIVDSHIKTLVVDSRVGWRDKIGMIHASFWIGAMYQVVQETLYGSVILKPGDAPLWFSVDQRTDHPWNTLLGTQWEFTEEWVVLVEGGFGDRDQILAGITRRF
jgi:hypothetical protein